jgi:hypothetical protein
VMLLVTPVYSVPFGRFVMMYTQPPCIIPPACRTKTV